MRVGKDGRRLFAGRQAFEPNKILHQLLHDLIFDKAVDIVKGRFIFADQQPPLDDVKTLFRAKLLVYALYILRILFAEIQKNTPREHFS